MSKLGALCTLFVLSITTTVFSFNDGNTESFDNGKYLSIQKLMESGRILVDLESPGGDESLNIEVRMKNLRSDSAHVWIEAGRRLESVDDAEQDILVVKNQFVSLAAGEAATVAVNGFCCQSKNTGPKEKSKFTIGAMAAAAWVFLANIIDKGNFPKKSVQHAVWCLSNDHDIRTIPVFRGKPTIKLRQAVADLKDVVLPWYSFGYKDDPEQLFSGEKEAIVAEVLYEVPNRAVMTVQIRNSAGKLVYQSPSYHASQGENIYFLEADIKGWPDGSYDFYLMEDFHTLNQKQSFTIDKSADQSGDNVPSNE
jgi:hypothetical protein